MGKVKILIVEDEWVLAEDLCFRLAKMGYNPFATASSVEEAEKYLRKSSNSIDIVVSDIKLKGELDGIHLGSIINSTFKLPFIFISSHADLPLVTRAKNVKPYAYLLKPFNDREIQIAIELAINNFQAEQLTAGQEHQEQSLKIRDCLFLKKKDHFQKVNLENILYLKADSNYTSIFTSNENYIYATVLKKIEERLPPSHFVRVHRSYIVNIENVTGFLGNMLQIGKYKIPISKVHQKEVFGRFNVV